MDVETATTAPIVTTPVSAPGLVGATGCLGPVERAGAAEAAVVQVVAVAGEAPRWSTEERRGVLERFDRMIDTLALARASVLVAERDSGAWQGAGDRSFEAWWGRTSRLGQRSAGVQVRQAENLGAVPAVADAVTDGRIGLEHATIIAKVAATGTPAQRRAASCPAGQAHLVEIAERQDADTFATTAARWAATVDPDALERDHQAQRAARFLHVVTTPRGTLVKGLLDTIAGHRLTLALEAVTPKPDPDDDRDPAQRCADALDTIATTILASAQTKPGAHVPPQITMILTQDAWLAAQGERDRRRRSAATFGFGPAALLGEDAEDNNTDADAAGGVSYPPATLEDGTPVPFSEVGVAMCECDLTRIVIDADGVPLDLGRTQRLFTGPQRRAVIARDRKCAWPQCTAPARWCQVHHVDWWERDHGPTTVDNGVLVCSFHHHEVHRQDLTITRHRVPQSRAPGTIARVTYEFADHTGRPIRSTENQNHPTSRNGAVSDKISGTALPTQRSATQLPPAAATTAEPPGEPPDEPPDELDFTPTLNPITGMLVPAFWLD